MGRPRLAAKNVRHFFEDAAPVTKPAPRAKKPAVQSERQAPPSNVNSLVRAVNKYDAGGHGRRLKGWNPSSTGPNRALENLDKIRARANDSAQNDWATSAGNRRWVTTLIGSGITPRPKRGLAQTRRQFQVDLWKRWTRYSDADGTLDFYGQEALATLGWMDCGETFGRLRYRRSDSGLEIPLQVQLLDPQYVPTRFDADTWPGLPRGNRIRMGIEFDRMGQRAAYWVYKSHPTDLMSSVINELDLVRVPADEMIHVFEPLRAGQIRGVPDSAPVLTYIREMLDFRGTVLERQKLANLITGFIKKPAPTSLDPRTDPMTGLPITDYDGDLPMVGLEPGTMQELGEGEDITWSNPPEAGTTYSDYVRTENLALAAGRNMPHEVLTGDILNISDRTLRILINDFRRFASQRQWHILIPQFCMKVRAAVGAQAALMGVLPMGELEDWNDCQWSPDAWPDIHPFQDIQGRQMQIDGGHRSRSSVIAERGEDPVEVDEERKEDKDREEEFGLAQDPSEIDPATGLPKPGGAKPGKKPTPKDDDGPVKDLSHLFDAVNARIDTLASAPAAAPPVINNTYTLPAVTLNATIQPTPIENKIEVPAAEVIVNNTVPVPDVTVNNTVPVPAVTVNNDVKPADVNVDVNLPDRQTTSVIDRDANGNITNVTQTETTLQ